MTFKRIITVMLLACFTMALFTAMPTYAMADSPTLSWEDKIDSAIWNTTPDENGRYLVYVSRTGVDDDKIEREFNRRNEFSLSDYQDKTTYRRIVGPTVALLAIEKYGMYNSLQLDYGRELFDDELAPIEYELIENYNEFIMNKRTVITDLYGTYNQSFADKFNIASDLVLYEGQYTGSYVLYATRDEIEAMAKDKSVESVMVWSETIDTAATNTQYAESNAIGQIGADSVAGTQSTSFNNGTGYKGTGIKIGIIESDYGKYDSDWVMLHNDQNVSPDAENYVKVNYLTNSYDGSTVPAEPNIHASLVTSIIVGKKIVVGSNVYEGVVPKATVYQTTQDQNAPLDSLFSAIDILLNQGVTVINFSGRASSIIEGKYDVATQEIDHYVGGAGVSFVTSAGNPPYDQPNNYNISAPGMGYNVITVGNLKTVENGGSESSTYVVSTTSSYREGNNYLTNKPDLVAPGTNITVPITNTELLDPRTGTSYAAPYVTGVIAQMFQANETLMGNPYLTKAILLAGADPTVVSNTGNEEAFTDSTLIREKSGVGMVNAINSIAIARDSNLYKKITLWLDGVEILGNHHVSEVELESGQTIRIVLTYNKPEYIEITSSGYRNDAALRLYKGNEPPYTSSHTYSNVEVIEHTATANETLDIEAYVTRYTRTPLDPRAWTICVAWRVIPSNSNN